MIQGQWWLIISNPLLSPYFLVEVGIFLWGCYPEIPMLDTYPKQRCQKCEGLALFPRVQLGPWVHVAWEMRPGYDNSNVERIGFLLRDISVACNLYIYIYHICPLGWCWIFQLPGQISSWMWEISMLVSPNIHLKDCLFRVPGIEYIHTTGRKVQQHNVDGSEIPNNHLECIKPFKLYNWIFSISINWFAGFPPPTVSRLIFKKPDLCNWKSFQYLQLQEKKLISLQRWSLTGYFQRDYRNITPKNGRK